MKIQKSIFGEFNNQVIYEYILDNEKNLQVKVLTFGGTIRELRFYGKNRVLGFDNLKDYIDLSPHFGALIGRVAGRISNGKICIDGKVYELDKNEGTTCLHGGRAGFSHRIWELENEEITDDLVSITLKYISKDMECGFPGQVTVYAKYTVNKDDTLIIEYFASTTKSTPITLTNHSYFNLNDSLEQDILDHFLKIDADNFIKLNHNNIPVRIEKVDDSPFDFRRGKKIKEDMDLSHKDLKYQEGYDHPFILNRSSDKQIELKSFDSGISLTMETTEPVVILYCSNKLNEGLVLSGGEKSFKYQGVCLETQWYPDALNQDFIPSNLLIPGEEYYSKTVYRFKKNRMVE